MLKEMVNSKWKTTAIIFIVLFTLVMSIMVWSFFIGTKMIENETRCAIDVCDLDTYTAYQYDEYEDVCFCFINK